MIMHFRATLILVLLATSASDGIVLHSVYKEFKERPPIVLVDSTSLLKTIGPGHSPEEVERAVADVKKRIDAYRRWGYLVLDAHGVLAAPEELLDAVPDLDKLASPQIGGAGK